MTSQIKTVLLLALLSAIIIGLGGIMGGRTGIIIAFVIAMIMNVGSYWYSDKIVLSMYQARELSEDEAPMLHRMVAELSANAGIPKPRVCVIPEDAPNAFATGRARCSGRHRRHHAHPQPRRAARRHRPRDRPHRQP